MSFSSTDNDVPSGTGQSSYRQIVRSSSIMGGVAAISLVFGMVRTKLAAVLIGTTGAGLLANFVALQGVLTTLSGLGIGSSAVRDVARAYAKEDQEEIARAVLTVRRVCWISGIAGALLTCIMSPWLSRLTFGSGEFTWHIAALALTILFGNLQGGQTALIQGSRRVGQLARLQLGAAAVGTAASVSMYLYFGVSGVVPALLLMSVSNYAIAWYFARQVPLPKVHMTYRESFSQAGTMARLGISMMWNSLAGSFATYAINAMITQTLGVQSLGIYSAAFALSGMFVNFVLGAMVSDYYPRLASVSDDDKALNQLVNQQTEVGLLLALPGLAATLALAPWAVHVFYTREFLPAVVLLQWLAVGCLGRVMSWPLGYLLMAKSHSLWMVACETAAHLLHLLLVYLGLSYFGLGGAAVAFVLLYVFYTALVFSVCRRVTGFAWTRASQTQMVISLLTLSVAWGAAQLGTMATAAGILCAVAAAIHSARGLAKRLGAEHPFTRAIERVPLLGNRLTSVRSH